MSEEKQSLNQPTNSNTLITNDFLQRITLLKPLTLNHTFSELIDKLQNNEFSSLEFKKIWKALFYAMWHSDKFVNQQALAMQISRLIQQFNTLKRLEQFYLYLQSMLYVLNHEWPKIDYWRINKFMSMVKLIFEEIFKLCKNFAWKQSILLHYNQIIENSLLMNFSTNEGLVIYYLQIFLETLLHAGDKIPQESLETLLTPFLNLIRFGENKILRSKIIHEVFAKIPEKNFINFNVIDYSQKIYNLATSKDKIEPQNRKSLFDICNSLSGDQILEPTQIEQEEQQLAQEEDEKKDQVQEQKKKKKKVSQLQEDIGVSCIENNESYFIENGETLTSQKETKKKKVQKKIEEKQNKALQILDEEITEQTPVQKIPLDENIEGLDYSEIKKSQEKMQILRDIMNSVPAYLFMSPNEKKKYFGSISKRYTESMNKEQGSKCSHERQVKFDLKKNQVKEFKSTEKVLSLSENRIKGIPIKKVQI